jgi:N-hydroxyarylamine O-acetyltransferase
MPDTLRPDQLAAYLARIGFDGVPSPDLAGLHAIHAAHAAAFPFENAETQMGRVPSFDPQAIFDKLVGARRGGWCYELNGLLARALTAIGFAVRRISAGVVRPDGEVAAGTHLALIVEADGPWLVDAGFGSWVGAPVPLRPGTWAMPPWPVTLARVEDQWQLSVDLDGRVMAYRFADAPADEALMARMCTWQGSDPESIFVQNFLAQRRQGTRNVTLRGRMLIEHGPDGITQHLLADPEALVAALRDRFGLDLPEAAALWPAITARHEELYPTAPTA